MKLFLKEWDELFLIKQSYHITNVDLDKMIDKILVFKEKFHLPPEILLSNQDVCKILNSFKDKNAICKLSDMNEEGRLIIVVGCDYMSYNDTEGKMHSDGLLLLLIICDDKYSINSSYLIFYAGPDQYAIMLLDFCEEKNDYIIPDLSASLEEAET